MRFTKNIIFDLGGVLLDIDFKATHQKFEELGIKDFEHYFSQHHATSLFEALETGIISPEIFYRQFREAISQPLTDGQIRMAWNAMLLHFSKEKMQWLEKISEQYKIYLFSNTNKIHYDYFTRSFREEMDGRELNSYFTKAWYSHEIGMRKPYPQTFSTILKQEGLLPGETLFIDDTIGNIEGARSTGMSAILLENPDMLLTLDL